MTFHAYFTSMIGDCPHCHVRVFANRDGQCPSCGKNVLDLAGVDANYTTVAVRRSSQMPSVCCQCGLPTTRFTKVQASWSRKVESEQDGGVLSLLLGFLLPIGLLVSGRRGTGTTHATDGIAIRIPQCDACATTAIDPVEVDYNRPSMKILVHKDFAREFHQENVG